MDKNLQDQPIFQSGLDLLQQGKYQEADQAFLKAHHLNPNNVDTLNLLGIRCYQKQDYTNALHFLSSANLIAPGSAHTLSNLGLVHNALLQFQAALECCDQAIQADDSIPEVHNNRGNSLKGLRLYQEAIVAYSRAIAMRPNYAEAMNNQGIILLEQNLPEKAIHLLDQAIKANPNLASAFNSLGNAFTLLGNSENAFQNFERALEINPNYLDACLNFGNSLKKFKQYAGAIQCYQHALKINPQHARAFYLLGELNYDIGNCALAKSYLTKSILLDATDIEARYALAIAQIPKVAESMAALDNSRQSFANELNNLQASNFLTPDSDIASKLIARHPFYLAYQTENNKPLLTQFGSICIKQAEVIQNELVNSSRQSNTNQKIRIAIVSHFFCDHPVWHAITKGWINHLNLDIFEIHLFNTGGTEDEETDLAKVKVSSYVNCGNLVSNTAQLIFDRNVDAILYPEIGMDTTSKALACLRLAPLQAASWGHPETTGLSTVDFYLSGSLLEPIAAKDYYIEELIKLPNLGAYFEQPAVTITDLNLPELGLTFDLPILLCAGSPAKYTPAYDLILLEIAKRLGKCQFVFFHFEENMTAVLKERLYQVFRRDQLNPEHFIKFIPFQKRDTFYGLMQKADLYLDTIGFSGFNTAMQAIICDLPVITVEGHWMRGRLASAILNRLGATELVCHSNKDYINKTVELIQTPKLLQAYKTSIATRKINLFNDLTSIRALEDFLTLHIKK